ncbi:MAG: tetratricopeptide repeat protein, partial [Myxococcota bacterium]
GPNEQTSLRTRTAEALEEATGEAEAAAELGPALEATPEHPAAAESLARLREAAEDPRGAAEAYEAAARAAHLPKRRVALWYRAGVLWQDELGEPERAIEALGHVAELDVTHQDAFERLRALFGDRDDTAELSRLVQRRLEAGGDAQALVQLHLAQADLCERLADRDGARQALRAALALDGNRVDALKRLAELSMEDADWRAATEALIRVARLRQDREELRWVFFRLGDIYDRHLPDPQRAEQAYQRVLKLAPDDVETLGRLAALYRRQERVKEAVAALRQLVERAEGTEERRDHALELAQVLEEHGELRAAEGELEKARREWPTDLVVLRAVADFYGRQKAESALAMHLGRAVGDLRQAVTRDPTDDAAWHGLVEVLGWRGRKDAARCCASVAAAFGVLDIELARLLDPRGGIPGAGAAAATDEVEEAIAPPVLTPSTRRVFLLASEALERVLPFDPKQVRAERAGRDAAVRRDAAAAMQHLGGGEVQVLVGDAMPRACLPVATDPVTLLVGRELLSSTDEEERRFLLLRAAKAARAGFAVAVRSDPAHLALAVSSLIRVYEPGYAPPGADARQLDDLARRVKKGIPRRARDELGPLVIDMAGAPGFDPTGLAVAASQLGDRFALVALGSFPAGLSALLKTAGGRSPGADEPGARAARLQEVPEARALFEFAVSDAHFTARQRAGADSR